MTTPIRKLLEDLEVAAQGASDEGACSDDVRNLDRVRGIVLDILNARLEPSPPPEWLIRVGPTIRDTSIFYRGEKIKGARRLRLESGFDDASILTLTVYTLDGVTIEGAQGLPADLECLTLRDVQETTDLRRRLPDLERVRALVLQAADAGDETTEDESGERSSVFEEVFDEAERIAKEMNDPPGSVRCAHCGILIQKEIDRCTCRTCLADVCAGCQVHPKEGGQ